MNNNFYKINIVFVVQFFAALFVLQNMLFVFKINSEFNSELVFCMSLSAAVVHNVITYSTNSKIVIRVILIYSMIVILTCAGIGKYISIVWEHQDILCKLTHGWNPLSLQYHNIGRVYGSKCTMGNAVLALPFMYIFNGIKYASIVDFIWSFALFCGLSLYLYRFKLSVYQLNFLRYYIVLAPYLFSAILGFGVDSSIYSCLILIAIGVFYLVNEDKVFGVKQLYFGITFLSLYIVAINPIYFIMLCVLFLIMFMNYADRLAVVNKNVLIVFVLLTIVLLYGIASETFSHDLLILQ